MTVAYGTIGDATFSVLNETDSYSTTITKPTSLGVGDFMVAIVGIGGIDIGNLTPQATSGWTSQATISDSGGGTTDECILFVLTKTADSSDVAASDFTFTPVSDTVQASQDGRSITGSIIRLTGDAPITSSAVIDGGVTAGSDTTTPTYTGGITPPLSSILIMASMSQRGNTSGTIATSGYAVTTDDPTWTERRDASINGSGGTVDKDYGFAIATAPRSETTATGDFSVTHSVICFSAGVLISVFEQQNVTVSGTTGTITLTGNDGTVAGDANITGSTGTITLAGNDGTVTTPDPDWVNVDKSSPSSWTNTSKS